MIKNKFLKLIIILSLIWLYSCSSINEVLQGNKRSEQSDEFLVEKKNPLVLPPDFEKLPEPGNEEATTEIVNDNKEIKDLLNIQDGETKDTNNAENSSDIESSILKKIQ